MSNTQNRSAELSARIMASAEEARKSGIKEPTAAAVAAVLAGEIETLRKRLTELEDRGLKFCGVWQRALEYRAGDSTTHKGQLWTAITATGLEPGTGPDWQLSARGN